MGLLSYIYWPHSIAEAIFIWLRTRTNEAYKRTTRIRFNYSPDNCICHLVLFPHPNYTFCLNSRQPSTFLCIHTVKSIFPASSAQIEWALFRHHFFSWARNDYAVNLWSNKPIGRQNWYHFHLFAHIIDSEYHSILHFVGAVCVLVFLLILIATYNGKYPKSDDCVAEKSQLRFYLQNRKTNMSQSISTQPVPLIFSFKWHSFYSFSEP